jgi:hypothetical protein
MSSQNNHQTPKPKRPLVVLLPSAKCSKCGRITVVAYTADQGRLLCVDCINKKLVCCWMFPEEDFEAWQEMIAEGDIEAAKLDCPSYASYREVIKSHRKDMHSSEMDTALVYFTVADMKAALEKEGLANTGKNRAKITWQKATANPSLVAH